MTAAFVQTRIWTLDEYIEQEEVSETKHEFHNGKLIEMAGGTYNHSRIGTNISTLLNMHLFSKNKGLGVCNSDIKIHISQINKTVYPDSCIIIEPPQFHEKKKHLVTNPLLIVEVLSKGTEQYDRGEKFQLYKKLPTFREYVLISQYQPLIEIFYLKDAKNGIWQYRQAEGLESSIKLQTIGCTLKLKDVYINIEDWEEESPPQY
jgi:Uma2 family endonuclease